MPIVKATGSFVVGVLLSLTSAAHAQCAPQWIATGVTPGVLTGNFSPGRVRAVHTWDPDGLGPAAPKLIVAGSFLYANTVPAWGVAAYDFSAGTWSPLGTGFANEVRAVTTASSGQLVVGGSFLGAGATSCAVAAWDGASWSALGTGLSAASIVTSLVRMNNGDLIAAGSITSPSIVGVSNIVRWDGSSWSSLGGGTNGLVSSMAVLSNGDLVVGGSFTSAGGVSASRVARWNGSSWSALGSGMNGNVLAVKGMVNGDIIAGGTFVLAGGISASNIARWNGGAWSPLGAGTNAAVHALEVGASGDLLAAGMFSQAGGTTTNCIARWNGSTWSALGAGVGCTPQAPTVRALCVLPGGDEVVGGDITVAGDVGALGVARWNGSVWSAFGTGEAMDSSIRSVKTLANGDLLAGGGFTSAGGVAASRIARRSNGAWAPLGAGIQGGLVYAMAEMANGDIVAAGSFNGAGGVSIPYIARWNGISWSSLGSGVSSHVYAVGALSNGGLVAGGLFSNAGGMPVSNIARWDGTSWSSFGSGTNSNINSLTELPNGDIVAGGIFTMAGASNVNCIARWNGAAWFPVGGGVAGAMNPSVSTDVVVLHVLPNGDLIAGGNFSAAGGVPAAGIARWDGLTWSPLGSGLPGVVQDVRSMPNGDLIAVYVAAGGSSGVRRWDGASWSNTGSTFQGYVWTAAVADEGELFVGGDFILMNSQVSSRSARYLATCPALVASTGTGCTSSGGSNTLAAVTSPWVDANFRTRGTGLPATATILAVTSVTSIPQGVAPLSLIFSQAGAGCDLLVAPDILQAGVTTTGIAQFEIYLPNTPPLVGVTFHQQLVPFEVDPLGAWVAVTATNRLQATVGAF